MTEAQEVRDTGNFFDNLSTVMSFFLEIPFLLLFELYDLTVFVIFDYT